MFRLTVNILHHLNQIIFITETDIVKMICQIKDQILLQHGQHLIHTVCHTEKFLHVYFDNVILIPIFFIRLNLADF